MILGPESRVLRLEDSTRVVKTSPPFVESLPLFCYVFRWVGYPHSMLAPLVGPAPSLAALFMGGGSIHGNGPEQ